MLCSCCIFLPERNLGRIIVSHPYLLTGIGAAVVALSLFIRSCRFRAIEHAILRTLTKPGIVNTAETIRARIGLDRARLHWAHDPGYRGDELKLRPPLSRVERALKRLSRKGVLRVIEREQRGKKFLEYSLA